MAWNRKNWRTTVCGGLAALTVLLPAIFPPAAALAPAFKAAEALAVALFGIFAGDAANTV